MNIVVNGKTERVSAGNVAEYIRTRGLDPNALVVEHNGQVISEPLWAGTPLCQGDQLELLSFVGGG